MAAAGLGLAFTVHYTDGTAAHLTPTQADMTRMEMRHGAEWMKWAEAHMLESIYFLAWLASRRDDTRPAVPFDPDWLDTVDRVEYEEVPVVPFAVAPPNGSPPSSPSPPPVVAPTRVAGSTLTPATP